MKTYDEACAESLEYFEKEHRKAQEERLNDLVRRAKDGDKWILGQLHLRSLSDGRVQARLAREPDLLRELGRHVGGRTR